MKKLFLTIIAGALLICSCNKSKQFTVTLNLDNADNQTVYLLKEVEGNPVCLDSAVFADNQAVLTAEADNPQLAYSISFNMADKCGNLLFFTENQNMTITGDRNDMQHWQVKGCAAQDAYNAFHESLLPFEEKTLELFAESEQAYLSGDTVESQKLFEQIQARMVEYNNFFLDYSREHPESFFGHFLLDQMKTDIDKQTVKEIAESFTTESIYSKSIQKYLEE